MNYDSCCALFGKKLEGFRIIHAQRFPRGKQLEDHGVIIEVGACAVSPRIALASCSLFPLELVGPFNPELGLDAAVKPLGNCFRGLDLEAVRVERFRVLVRGLKRFETMGSFLADRDNLERNDIDVA